MSFTPESKEFATGSGAVVVMLPGGGSVKIPASALLEAKDGTSAPLSHEAGEVASAAHHGLILRSRRVDAAAVLAGVASGDYSDLIVGDDGALWARLSQALPAGSAKIGDVGISTRTSGGATPFRLISAASTNATSVKGSAGQVYSIIAGNANASPRYLKLYNKASAPAVGSDAPVHTIMLPAGGGIAHALSAPLAFATGIALALTTGATDGDTGAVATSEITVNLGYA